MPYTVKLSNGQMLVRIPDRTFDTSTTSLTLVGRGSINYGTDFATNFVHLLENFAHVTPPIVPLKGQIWYDTTLPPDGQIKLWNGQRWVDLLQRTADGSTNVTNIYVSNQVQSDTIVANTSVTAPWFYGNLHGNADTASKWQTARTINLIQDAAGSVSFDGSADFNLPVTVHRWTLPRTFTIGGAVAATASVDGSADVTFNTTFNTTGGLVPIKAQDAAHADKADLAQNANLAQEAAHAGLADRARGADFADQATHAGSADNATHASYADRLTNARAISLTGAVNGGAWFDGTANINIATSVAGPDLSGYVRKTGDTMSGGLACPLFYVDDGFYMTIGSSAIDGGPLSKIQCGGNQWMGFARNSGVWEWYNPTNHGLYGEFWSNSGDFYAVGNIASYRQFSDIRLKSNIKPLTGSLQLILSMQGYSYDKLNEYTKKVSPEVGVIAQDVEKLIPTAVSDYRDTKVVFHEQIIPHLIEAIKTLEARVAALEAKLGPSA
jgi:hypothetical protein